MIMIAIWSEEFSWKKVQIVLMTLLEEQTMQCHNCTLVAAITISRKKDTISYQKLQYEPNLYSLLILYYWFSSSERKLNPQHPSVDNQPTNQSTKANRQWLTYVFSARKVLERDKGYGGKFHFMFFSIRRKFLSAGTNGKIIFTKTADGYPSRLCCVPASNIRCSMSCKSYWNYICFWAHEVAQMMLIGEKQRQRWYTTENKSVTANTPFCILGVPLIAELTQSIFNLKLPNYDCTESTPPPIIGSLWVAVNCKGSPKIFVLQITRSENCKG